MLTLAGITLLARVLAPRDFGLIGFAMVYLTFVEVIGDFGAASALVYWPDRRDDAAQVTFIISVLAGIFWCVVSLILAPYVAQFFHEPDGTAVIRALSVTTIIKFLGNAHDALAQKDLRFRARSIPEMALTGIKAIVALALAYLGFGAWSLVWGHVAGITAATVLLWVVVPWRPTLSVPRDLFRPMLQYGRNIVAVELLSAMMFDLDVVVVGRFLGVTALGLYQMAERIPQSTVMVLLWTTSQALFPAFSKVHADKGDLRNAFLLATRFLSAVTLPASIGLAFLARPIVLVFFGARWAGAAPILSILAIYVGFRGADEVTNVLKATGRTSALVWLIVLKTVILAPSVVIAARFSASAVALALAIVYGIGTVVTTVIAAHLIDVSLLSIAAAYRGSVGASAIMSVVLFGWMHWSSSLGSLTQLAGGLTFGVVTYVAALRLVDPGIFVRLRGIVFRKPLVAT